MSRFRKPFALSASALLAISFAVTSLWAAKPAPPPPPPPPISYALTLIAPPPGTRVSQIVDMNESGDMVGYLVPLDANTPSVAFVFLANAAGDGGSFYQLDDLLSPADREDWTMSRPFAINNGSPDDDPRIPQIACRGYYEGAETETLQHNYTYSVLLSVIGEIQPKGLYPTSDLNGMAWVNGLNDLGDRCGEVPLNAGGSRAFVIPADVDPLAGGLPTFLFGSPADPTAPKYSEALAINESGQVVGRVADMGFRYTPGTASTPPVTITLGRIGTKAATGGNRVSDINDSGQFCGQAPYFNTLGIAYRYTNGVGMVPLLTTDSQALGITSQGDVLGEDFRIDRTNAHMAFIHLYQANKLVYLSTAGVVTGAAADVQLWNHAQTYWNTHRAKINKSGVIAGPLGIQSTAPDRSRDGFLYILRPR